ncbi:hypothetical protein ASF61_06715 [Duganella sp. Leaf126]|uniref:hypothetical protein n=1 Tax=Duganella sp. Leaf126 TaxID=1736266 RepID=UPI000701DBB6|nr:hypothetical protein [Duganella sp. Leaf126]KQQ40440.1 hypothetical protein ASF61_06715 [Duganella sp. Leaf126]
MIYDLSREERRHRAIANEKPAPVLRPQRCACGKAAPAKQLVQHQHCVACLFAARVATLQDDDLDVLHHMLGATGHHPQSRWGFRNEYLANRRDLLALERLVAGGFVRAGTMLLDLRYFHATRDGCKLAGLSAVAARHALELLHEH